MNEQNILENELTAGDIDILIKGLDSITGAEMGSDLMMMMLHSMAGVNKDERDKREKERKETDEYLDEENEKNRVKNEIILIKAKLIKLKHVVESQELQDITERK